jgi:beta-lactamase class A
MSQHIEEIFGAAGCVGTLCVQDAEGQREVSIAADQPVVAASVIKVLVAVEVERQIGTGALNPTKRIEMSADARTPGPVGFSLYEDGVEASLRDLLVPMLTISDNVATDALLAEVGVARCNATAVELGLAATVVEGDLHSMIDSIGQAAGFAGWDALATWSEGSHSAAEEAAVQAHVLAAAPMQAETATRTTARDMCLLLHLIWSDRAAPKDGCQRIRNLMRRQLTRHRLASAFAPPARVSAKSGSLLGVYRNEVGVVEYPDGRWYTVAVFTRSSGSSAGEGAINASIGLAAARAVDLLKAS